MKGTTLNDGDLVSSDLNLNSMPLRPNTITRARSMLATMLGSNLYGFMMTAHPRFFDAKARHTPEDGLGEIREQSNSNHV